ncbi:MAG: SRPBCC family protein [Saprospiraceae bacterium]|nr:SRPBCC family protein [Saprospiraceae bacterium]
MSTSIQINRDPSTVFHFIADPENNPKWQSGMKSCQWSSRKPNWLGSIYVQQANFLGKEIESTFEIVEFKGGQMIKGRSISGTFPITFTRIVEGAATGCQVTAIIEGDPKGVFKIAKPLMTWMVKHSIEKDYQKLKELMEQKKEEI